MDKKDIYEHLAKIYLDTPLKSEKRIKDFSPEKVKRHIVFVITIAIMLISAGLFFIFRARHAKLLPNSEIAHLIQTEVTKINYSFDPAKKEVYTIDLGGRDLSAFKALVFSAKKSNYGDSMAVRVEFINTLQERSELYIKDISHKWKHYKIPLSDFKNIIQWSALASLSFIIEEWNTSDKQGSVYIDNVRLLR